MRPGASSHTLQATAGKSPKEQCLAVESCVCAISLSTARAPIPPVTFHSPLGG